VCDVLQKGFVKVVAVQLGLSGPDADDAHFQLNNFITDVFVTRNRLSHGHRLSVTQVVRAMASLLGIISKLGCDAVSAQVACDAITTCIAHVHARDQPGSPVTLTVSSVACLFYTRALRRLCKAINVDDISKEVLYSRWPNRSQEITHVLHCVWNGKLYLHHGKCNKKSMALLVCICGVSRLLRSLGHSYFDDAAACDADILHLLERMQLCDGRQLLQAVSDHHRHM
jgi:hypothetical protein